MRYDAFVSYSQSGDSAVARAVQRGLTRFAKRWNQRASLRVFRDETGLGANPNLWSSIQLALDDSDWLVLLTSPAAAASDAVTREVEYWLSVKSSDRILIVLTGGTWKWDLEKSDFHADR